MATAALWVESYRPTTLDGYVFKDKHQQDQIQNWVMPIAILYIAYKIYLYNYNVH